MTNNRVVATVWLLMVGLMGLMSCHSNVGKEGTANDGKRGHVIVVTQDADAGELSQGDVVGVRYSLRNEGDGSFVIVGVETDCGCTKARYSNEPIAGGKETSVELIFDTAGLHGYQFKTAKVTAQCGNGVVETVKLKFKAIVR